MGPFSIRDRLFYDVNGNPVIYKGVSAFPLCDMYVRGLDLDPWFEEFKGFNVARVWSYVEWEGTGWESPPLEMIPAFVEYMRDHGFEVEWTLLTGDSEPERRIARALEEIDVLAGMGTLLEAGNEPLTHKTIDVDALRSALEASGNPYSSGIYEDSNKFWGTYLVAHTPRDEEWPRKCHDLQEYWSGGGPHDKDDPAHHVPGVADEPIRPDQAPEKPDQHIIRALDYRAYGAGSMMMGSGATFHYEGGKDKHDWALTDDERLCRDELLFGLSAFPADTVTRGYNRIDEHGNTLRTYWVGDAMVRIRPVTKEPPEPGWSPLDTDGVLFRRG